MAFDISISVLYLFMAVNIIIFLVGMVMFFRKIEGAPFISLFAGIIMFALLVLINNIEVDYVEAIQYNLTFPMNVTTSDSSIQFSTTITGQAERPANVNSLLVNKKISCIEINMFRTGSPTDNIMIGILDDDNRVIKLFGNITASSINTVTRSYQVCLPNHDYWILAYNDRVGAKYTGVNPPGTSIAVSMNTANPFDSTNSVRTTYTSGLWSDTTGTDLRMKLTNEDTNIVGKPVLYKFNQHDIYPFMIFLSVVFVFLAVIFQLKDWT